jgi:hypothetical protein
MARLNSAKSRVFPVIRSCVRTVQISASFSGGFCPISLPLFHGSRKARCLLSTGVIVCFLTTVGGNRSMINFPEQRLWESRTSRGIIAECGEERAAEKESRCLILGVTSSSVPGAGIVVRRRSGRRTPIADTDPSRAGHGQYCRKRTSTYGDGRGYLPHGAGPSHIGGERLDPAINSHSACTRDRQLKFRQRPSNTRPESAGATTRALSLGKSHHLTTFPPSRPDGCLALHGVHGLILNLFLRRVLFSKVGLRTVTRDEAAQRGGDGIRPLSLSQQPRQTGGACAGAASRRPPYLRLAGRRPAHSRADLATPARSGHRAVRHRCGPGRQGRRGPLAGRGDAGPAGSGGPPGQAGDPGPAARRAQRARAAPVSAQPHLGRPAGGLLRGRPRPVDLGHRRRETRVPAGGRWPC